MVFALMLRKLTCALTTGFIEIVSDGPQEPGRNITDSPGFFNNSRDCFFYRPVMNSINETKEKGTMVSGAFKTHINTATSVTVAG